MFSFWQENIQCEGHCCWYSIGCDLTSWGSPYTRRAWWVRFSSWWFGSTDGRPPTVSLGRVLKWADYHNFCYFYLAHISWFRVNNTFFLFVFELHRGSVAFVSPVLSENQAGHNEFCVCGSNVPPLEQYCSPPTEPGGIYVVNSFYFLFLMLLTSCLLLWRCRVSP